MSQRLSGNKDGSADVLYYLHIPKTAGTTFNAILDSQFHPHEICPVNLWSSLINVPARDLARYRLIRGHFYNHVKMLWPGRLRYITLLRDPVERTISHYEHIRRSPNHYFHDKVRTHKNLLEFIRDPETRPLMANFQTRAIALDLDPRAIAATLDEAALKDLVLERILETADPANLSPKALLEIAKERLRQFTFVGITEYFQESMLLLTHTLGWEPITNYSMLNTTDKRLQRQELSQLTIHAIWENSRFDVALYKFAKQLFRERLQQVPAATASVGRLPLRPLGLADQAGAGG